MIQETSDNEDGGAEEEALDEEADEEEVGLCESRFVVGFVSPLGSCGVLARSRRCLSVSQTYWFGPKGWLTPGMCEWLLGVLGGSWEPGLRLNIFSRSIIVYHYKYEWWRRRLHPIRDVCKFEV
jgi:hypothetical protein